MSERTKDVVEMLMSEDMQMEQLSKLFVLIVIVVCVVKNGGKKETCYN